MHIAGHWSFNDVKAAECTLLVIGSFNDVKLAVYTVVSVAHVSLCGSLNIAFISLL